MHFRVPKTRFINVDRWSPMGRQMYFCYLEWLFVNNQPCFGYIQITTLNNENTFGAP